MADPRVDDFDHKAPVKRRAPPLSLSYSYTPPTPTPLRNSESAADSTPIPANSNRQQNQNPSSQPPAAGGLLGGATGGTTTGGGGSGLFGGGAQQSQPQNTSSLFGGAQNQTQTTTGGSSLFGGGQQQNQQQNTSSLFGGGNAATTTNTGGSGLFGGQQQNQQQNRSSLFGGTGAAGTTTGGGLFGGQQTQQQGTSSLFGGQQNQQQGGTSTLFGGQQNQQQPSSSFMGLSATQPTFNQPSLLGASQYRASQMQPFAGRLTMGQQQSTSTTGAAAGGATGTTGAQGAVQINFETMRPTTRFNDCVPELQAELEKMDAMIAAQERFCRDIEAFLPAHGEKVRSLKPDVELVTEKKDAVEHALSMDAQAVESEKAVLANDQRDGERVKRVVDNLRQPSEFRYRGFPQAHPSEDSADGAVVKDMDLIGNYFIPLTSSLQSTLDAYTGNLAEIEQHLRVIESSAVAQAQQLSAKRAGLRPDQGQNGEETVRELADTLRGFEQSILGAASNVGVCREGLNELVLRRL